jgi:glycosyltransferase involved in cell wall biosynthesis
MARVSVIIPTYNAEKYIAKTIQSVLNQTYQDFEVLVIDDASPDRSVAVCRQFKDSRIRVISQANRGLPGARNTGIRAAKGEFIAFLDADDIWLPEKLEKHVQQLDQRPEVGISFSYSAFIDDTDALTGLYQKPQRLEGITPDYVLCRNPIGNGSAAVLRRAVFEDIAFDDDKHGKVETCYFDERVNHHSADATDVECWLRISITTRWAMAGIAEPLTQYRIHTGGLSANVLKQLESLEAVIEKTRGYAPDIIRRCEHRAKAYHLRYIARRAVTLRDGKLAVSMMHRSLASNWQIILEEPKKTAMTAGAAYCLRFLPQKLYTRLENRAMQSLIETPATAAIEPAIEPVREVAATNSINPFIASLPVSEMPSQRF